MREKREKQPTKRLFTAVKQGNEKAVQEYLARAAANRAYCAVLSKQPDAGFSLRSADAVNITDAAGNTLLIQAARYGQESIVRLLLEQGANMTVQNKQGETALVCAKQASIRELIMHKLLEEQVKLQAEAHGALRRISEAVNLILTLISKISSVHAASRIRADLLTINQTILDHIGGMSGEDRQELSFPTAPPASATVLEAPRSARSSPGGLGGLWRSQSARSSMRETTPTRGEDSDDEPGSVFS